ncbi:lymphocyte antigen 6G-like [Oreochromis aureus]|uniref:lymphocyte antigen 6G-like n=1 Tax=Oreochromis aureus TaxID=47969 RepID=UPI0003945CDA|nr:lymphocyte antigen 6G-like [Oreochromis aureus]
MMQLYGALILCVTLSAACGLKCYTCAAADPKSCTDTTSCAFIFNRCFSGRVDGLNVVTKGCLNSVACVWPMSCCEGDLCNSTIPTGPSAILLLVSSAILKFLF